MSENGKAVNKKYTSELQQKIHVFLLKLKRVHITKVMFETVQKDIFVPRFGTYEDFEFISNQYLWETYFKYDNDTLKYFILKIRELQASHKESELQLTNFFLLCMSTPPKAPDPKKEEIKVKRESALSLDSLLEGEEEKEDDGVITPE